LPDASFASGVVTRVVPLADFATTRPVPARSLISAASAVKSPFTPFDFFPWATSDENKISRLLCRANSRSAVLKSCAGILKVVFASSA